MNLVTTLVLGGMVGVGAWITQASAQSPEGTIVAFTGARVVSLDATPGVSDAVILVRDGRIVQVGTPASVQVPAGASRVDLGGRFVIPGLISTHVHLNDLTTPDEQLGVFARYGVTSVWSLGGEPASTFRLRDAAPASAPGRARVWLSGDIVTGPTPEAARAQVQRVAALKPDMVKIRVDDNLGTATKMTPEVFRAVIDEAHRLGLRVAAHVFYLDDAKALLRAGVDMIAHSVRDRDIDEEFIGLMKARNVPYCPTLTRELSTFVYESEPSFFSDPFFLREADAAVVARLKEPARQRAMAESKSAQAYKAALVVARRNLKKAADAGVAVVMGTDAGPFPERFQGHFEHLELAMMVEAGLSPAQVLRSATIDASRVMGMKDAGRLAPGAWADFVVLERNPLEDIRRCTRRYFFRIVRMSTPVGWPSNASFARTT